MENIALVVTTIAEKNYVLSAFEAGCRRQGWDYIVVGDEKSPNVFELDYGEYFDLLRQETISSNAIKSPLNHYSRKNFGYLAAVQRGAQYIVDTDDDNLPLNDFWKVKNHLTSSHQTSDEKFVNIYKYFSDKLIWPRGYPLSHVKDKFDEKPLLKLETEVEIGIHQGLADENPDVDAIYRFLFEIPFYFKKRRQSIILHKDCYCPFNSQNTIWSARLLPLMYLPATAPFRMTDIWRSYIATRICHELDIKIGFGNSTVIQERNHHILQNDFNDEVSGYIKNEAFVDVLMGCPLAKHDTMEAMLMTLYQALVKNDLIDKSEMTFLESWLGDCNSCYDQH